MSVFVRLTLLFLIRNFVFQLSFHYSPRTQSTTLILKKIPVSPQNKAAEVLACSCRICFKQEEMHLRNIIISSFHIIMITSNTASSVSYNY